MLTCLLSFPPDVPHRRYFNWRTHEHASFSFPGTRQVGLLAQDVEAVLPELVSVVPANGYKSVDYSRLSVLLLSANAQLAQRQSRAAACHAHRQATDAARIAALESGAAAAADAAASMAADAVTARKEAAELASQLKQALDAVTALAERVQALETSTARLDDADHALAKDVAAAAAAAKAGEERLQGALVDAQASLRKELTTAVDSASSATTSAVEGAKRLAKSAQDAADGANHKVRDLETRLASTERSLKTLELLKRSG